MDIAELERLAAENQALRRKLDALEAEKTAWLSRDAERASRLEKLDRILGELPLIVDIFDVSTTRSVYKNISLDAFLGYPEGALAAMGPQPTLYKTVHPDDIPRVVSFFDRLCNEKGEIEDPFVEYRVRRGDGEIGWLRAQIKPFDRDENGSIKTVLMITHDISTRKVAEDHVRALNDELDEIVAERTAKLEETNQSLLHEIEARTALANEAERRARLIHELSSPLLQVWEDVLAIPIIGALDAERANRISTSLLNAISQTNVRFVILDLTNVGEMDEETAEHIERVVAAAVLLGVEVVLSGIGPLVARRMVERGLSLNGIKVKNLREALRHCIRRRTSSR